MTEALDAEPLTATRTASGPPTAADFTRELIEFISEEVATHDEPIDANTDLLLTGLVDSLGVVMVSTWMQDTLEITIDPGDIVLEHFQTVGQMVAYARARGVVQDT